MHYFPQTVPENHSTACHNVSLWSDCDLLLFYFIFMSLCLIFTRLFTQHQMWIGREGEGGGKGQPSPSVLTRTKENLQNLENCYVKSEYFQWKVLVESTLKRTKSRILHSKFLKWYVQSTSQFILAQSESFVDGPNSDPSYFESELN